MSIYDDDEKDVVDCFDLIMRGDIGAALEESAELNENRENHDDSFDNVISGKESEFRSE